LRRRGRRHIRRVLRSSYTSVLSFRLLVGGGPRRGRPSIKNTRNGHFRLQLVCAGPFALANDQKRPGRTSPPPAQKALPLVGRATARSGMNRNQASAVYRKRWLGGDAVELLKPPREPKEPNTKT
jgi:hypothetical protein